MKKSFVVSFFAEKDRNDWERLILRDAVNGLFIQTRKFIDYHPAGKFKDASICIRRGQELVGAILAAEVVEDGVKTFFAHPGTTFGGLTVISSVLKSHEMNSILETVENFLRENGFEKIYLKLVPSIYSKIPTDLIDYLLSYRKYLCNSELNFVLDLPRDIDPIEIFSAEKRRGTRYSMKNDLEFHELDQILGGGGAT